MLNEEQVKELKSLVSKLINLNSEKLDLEFLKLEREEALKNDIATVCKIVDKNQNPLSTKVKMPFVISIINELYKDKENKFDVDYETMQIYKRAIEKKEVSQELVDSYITVNDLLDENKANLKEVFKESSILPKEVLDAVILIAKEDYQNKKDERLFKEYGKEKKQKDNSDILSLKDEILKILEDNK